METSTQPDSRHNRLEPVHVLQHDKITGPGPSPDTTDSRRSWRAPLTIVIGLIGGLSFALAHHVMGSVLNLKPVDDIWLSQAWISRFGTAFAFLVKMMLAIGVGTAYVQYQWTRLHRQSFNTADMDALTSVLSNVVSLCNVSIWMRIPMLAIVALVSW